MLWQEFKKEKDNEQAKQTNVERVDWERKNKLYARWIINLGLSYIKVWMYEKKHAENWKESTMKPVKHAHS